MSNVIQDLLNKNEDLKFINIFLFICFKFFKLGKKYSKLPKKKNYLPGIHTKLINNKSLPWIDWDSIFFLFFPVGGFDGAILFFKNWNKY